MMNHKLSKNVCHDKTCLAVLYVMMSQQTLPY